jgi:hypothetical protein
VTGETLAGDAPGRLAERDDRSRPARSWRATLTRIAGADARFLLGHFVLSRAIYLGAGVLTAMLVATPDLASSTGSLSLGRLAGTAAEATRNLLVFGDGDWYRTIVEDGYAPGPFDPTLRNNWPFFPLFPALVAVLGGSTAAGVLIANAATLVAARLLLGEVAADRGRIAGRWTVLFLLYWPFSNMLSAFRPEALILLGSVVAWVAARHGRWWWAWLGVAIAALARPPGLLIAIVVVAEAWRQAGRDRRARGKALAGAVLPVAGLVAFSLHQGAVVGDPLGWARAQAAWGRGFDPIGTIAAYWTNPLFVRWRWDFALLNWVILAALLAAAARLVRRGDRTLGAYLAVYAAVPALTGNVVAMGRYASTMFPAALLAATDRRTRTARVGLLVLFAALLGAVGAWTALELRPVLP